MGENHETKKNTNITLRGCVPSSSPRKYDDQYTPTTQSSSTLASGAYGLELVAVELMASTRSASTRNFGMSTSASRKWIGETRHTSGRLPSVHQPQVQDIPSRPSGTSIDREQVHPERHPRDNHEQDLDLQHSQERQFMTKTVHALKAITSVLQTRAGNNQGSVRPERTRFPGTHDQKSERNSHSGHSGHHGSTRNRVQTDTIHETHIRHIHHTRRQVQSTRLCKRGDARPSDSDHRRR